MKGLGLSTTWAMRSSTPRAVTGLDRNSFTPTSRASLTRRSVEWPVIMITGAVDMTAMPTLMAKSRIVLNTNGNFGAGSHERPFSASLAGAATFSDFSRYYAEVFKPGENIELFSWTAFDLGMGSLAALAADPERCWAYGRRAQAVAVDGHTWDRRLDIVLTAANWHPV